MAGKQEETSKAVELPLKPEHRDTTSTKPSTGDPKFDAENTNWISARAKANELPDDAAAWDSLVIITEQLLQKYSSPSDTVKRVITDTFDEILTRFPLLYTYWKKYTALQYQMNGLDASLNTLSRALDAFPASLDLWVDYLTLLVSNLSDDTRRLRTEFEAAVRFVGNQFLSHPIWDKYIEFEKSQKEDKNVLSILLRATKIPLHQYARFYQDIIALKDTIPVDDIIALDSSISQQIPDNATQEQKQQIITDHITRVCTNTYNYVTEIWPYEGRLTGSVVFTPLPLATEVSEFWITYLDFQIKKFEDDPSDLNKAQTVSLFERSLIPAALEPKFWTKYLGWALKHFADEFDLLNGIYNRAVNLYVPLNLFLIRLNYALFLEIHNQDSDKIHELYLNLINNSPAEPLPLLQYIQFVSRENQNYKRTAEWIDSILTVHFNVKKPETELDQKAKRLSKALNDKTAGILVAELIKSHWHHGKDHLKVKMLLSFYSKQESLSGSVQYWSVAFQYQRTHGDSKAVEKVVKFIRDSSSLPLTLINSVLLTYADYLQQNINADNTSKGPTTNIHTAVLELEYDVTHPLHYRITTEKQLKRARAESGHAAVYIDKPTVTNSTLERPTKRRSPASLPTFKNVEKASVPIEYTKNN